RFAGLVPDPFDVASALQAVLGGPEGFHATLVVLGREQARVLPVRLRERFLRVLKEGFPELVLGRPDSGEPEHQQRDEGGKKVPPRAFSCPAAEHMENYPAVAG